MRLILTRHAYALGDDVDRGRFPPETVAVSGTFDPPVPGAVMVGKPEWWALDVVTPRKPTRYERRHGIDHSPRYVAVTWRIPEQDDQ